MRLASSLEQRGAARAAVAPIAYNGAEIQGHGVPKADGRALEPDFNVRVALTADA